jgi:nitrate reductase / nitrite oxidoreductase, beta subunit
VGQHEQLFCSLDTDGGPGMGGYGPPGPHGIASYRPASESRSAQSGSRRTGFNLLNWNGKDLVTGMFPKASDG